MNIKTLSCIFLLLLLSGCHPSHKRYQGYIEGKSIYLASPSSGLLNLLSVKRGQRIKKGTLLFKLDASPQLEDLHDAVALLQQGKKTVDDLEAPKRPPEMDFIKAQIAQSDAQIHLSELRLHRNQKLYEKNATDKDSVDAAAERYAEMLQTKAQFEANLRLAQLGSREGQINSAKAKVASLEALVLKAKWQLAQKTLYAPVDGIIFDTYFSQGEFVPAQKPVVAILDADNIRVEFFVPLRALSSIKLGQKIEFECEGESKRNVAVIDYISPTVEYIPPLVYSRDNDDKLVFRVKAATSNPYVFKPGQPVTVIG